MAKPIDLNTLVDPRPGKSGEWLDLTEFTAMDNAAEWVIDDSRLAPFFHLEVSKALDARRADLRAKQDTLQKAGRTKAAEAVRRKMAAMQDGENEFRAFAADEVRSAPWGEPGFAIPGLDWGKHQDELAKRELAAPLVKHFDLEGAQAFVEVSESHLTAQRVRVDFIRTRTQQGMKHEGYMAEQNLLPRLAAVHNAGKVGLREVQSREAAAAAQAAEAGRLAAQREDDPAFARFANSIVRPHAA